MSGLHAALFKLLLPLPLGEVAERSEDGEGNTERSPKDPLSHLR